LTAIDEAPAAIPARPDRAEARSRKRAERRRRLLRDRSLLIMTVPAVLLLLVFNYAPMFGTVTAFQSYSIYAGFMHSPWTGLDTFKSLFSDPLFWSAFENTLTLSLVQLFLFFPVPILLALLLNSIMSSKVRTVVQSVVYLPHFFSWVLTITIFQQMLGGAGLLNQYLRSHGMSTWDIMTNPHTFALLVTSQAVWKEAGWSIIVFLAALAAINTDLYEAAAADGAGRWRRLGHITLPGLRPVIVLLLILRLGDALSVGFEQYILQREAVGRQAAEVLDTFVYWQAIVPQQWGLGAAAGLFKGAVGLLLILVANKVAHKLGEQGVYSKS